MEKYPLRLNLTRPVVAEERVVVTDAGNSDHSRALYLEQNDVVWVKNAIRKVTLPVNTVVDTCSRTFATGKAYILLPGQPRFVR